MSDQRAQTQGPDIELLAKATEAHLDHADDQKPGAEWEQLLRDAQQAEEEEKNMPLKEAFRVYPKAMFWTFAVTMCFVM